MKFSSKIEACGLSPIRKFHPYVVAAEAKGRKVLHLNKSPSPAASSVSAIEL